MVASGATNLIANYVPSQNSIINFFPNKFSQKSSGILIIFLGLIFAVFWDPVLSKIGILSFVDTIGSFFGPIAGIMIVDYYVIKNKKIINKDIFSSMQPHAYFVNIARGDVVNERDLIDALKLNQIAGAGLDVYEHEPKVPEDLIAMENVVLLPHLGTASLEVRTGMGLMAVQNIKSFIEGNEPPNLV